MLKGSCCCNTVKFELSEPPSMMGMCHCSRCRKVGASSLVFVKAEALTITSGKGEITEYKAQAPYKYNRCFCSRCGTSLGEILSSDEVFPISAHCIDDELKIENQFHEFVIEKPKWSIIGDNAKQFMGHPEE